jgi:branched-chain amino acid transport system permease protein
MSTLVDAIVLGLFQAAPLSLAAVGFTLIFYLSRFINVAYGENLTLGAYTAIFLNTTLGLNFYLAIVPAALLTGVIRCSRFSSSSGPRTGEAWARPR